jgi:hypothetical protein
MERRAERLVGRSRSHDRCPGRHLVLKAHLYYCKGPRWRLSSFLLLPGLKSESLHTWLFVWEPARVAPRLSLTFWLPCTRRSCPCSTVPDDRYGLRVSH